MWHSVCKVIHSVKTELTTLQLEMLWKNTTSRKLPVKTETDIPFKVASLMWKLNTKNSVLIELFWKLWFWHSSVSVAGNLAAFWKLRFGCIMQGVCGPACLLTDVPVDLLVVLICLFSFFGFIL